MIFGRKKKQKDPVIGVDVGTSETYLGGLSPKGTEQLTVNGSNGLGPFYPTRGLYEGDSMKVGHQATDAFEQGLPAVDIMAPFKYGREVWTKEIGDLEEDPQEPLRRRYFEYLYDQVDAEMSEWERRIAIPVRPARQEAGQALLEEYLMDAGFEIEHRVSNPLATALGYWEYDRLKDPHFEMDWFDGGILLTIDIGVQFIDVGVFSVQAHNYRELAVEHGAFENTQIEFYAEYKAEQAGIDISLGVENAARRFGLINQIQQHYPSLVTGETDSVTVTVPDEFGAESGTMITLESKEVQQSVSEQLMSVNGILQKALHKANLTSVTDVDLIISGGIPSRWVPVLQWWVRKDVGWGLMDDPSNGMSEDASVRMTSGIAGKILAAQGTVALSHSNIGHAKHDITVS